jgi:hypothetical protein
LESLKVQVSALKSEVQTLKDKKQMKQINWLKRKIEQFMSKMPEADYSSPIGSIYPSPFAGMF